MPMAAATMSVVMPDRKAASQSGADGRRRQSRCGSSAAIIAAANAAQRKATPMRNDSIAREVDAAGPAPDARPMIETDNLRREYGGRVRAARA